ncbi:protein-disulfide isomerase [Arthrobacter stackebrandtii]|uniref:Protein-disulfide isomerase n=1 Tax=Arthrobacter stackebrandtii TaxID=272161 RepID=A0ABS4YSF8_9MICC|nr:thioredoxin domain-containing protein [Arthrobacter stackebrandtii]MBP2411726.1 protein-disulfide isomerase [Arthrobacter stackebrandtii]PYG99638.1 disulfide bond formation protein [Arthrobacter stackebrandtii]
MAAKKMAAKKTRNVVLALVLCAVLVLAVIFVGEMARQDRLDDAGAQLTAQPGPGTAEGTAPPVDLARRIADDPLAVGAVDAPVVMVEYSDYTCPYCGAYARKTQPEIVKKYVDSGQLRIEWRDLPVIGEQSVSAAVAGRAAGEQGLFWEFNDAVYTAAPERGKADLSEAVLVKFAEQVGVPDMDKFKADLQSQELLERVHTDMRQGTGLGLNSTPTFVINNQAIPGAQPMEVFSQVIDEALAQVK